MRNNIDPRYDLSDLGGVLIESDKDPYDLSDLGGVKIQDAAPVNAERKAVPEDIFLARTYPDIAKVAYDNFSQLPPEARREMFNDLVGLAVKAPIAGASSVLDFFTTHPLNAAVSAYNTIAPEDYQLPHAKTFEQKAEEGVDYIAGAAGIDTTKRTPLYEGAKFATSVALPGGVASKLSQVPKAVGGMPRVAQALEGIGSTSPRTIAGAAGAGTAMEAARESGVGTGATLASGVAGAAAVETLPFVLNTKFWTELAKKGAVKGLGLGKGQIKTEAIDAAGRLGVDLPATAATDSVLMSLTSQFLSKMPKLGDKLRAQVKETSEQFQKAWSNMLDEVAPKLERELSEEAEAIYKIPRNLLKDSQDDVSPSLILDKIKELRDFLKSPIYSEPSEKLIGYMNKLENALAPKSIEIMASDLPKGFERLSKDAQEQVLSQIKTETLISHIPIQQVLRAKIELNKIMRDKNLFSRTDKDSLDFLKGLKASVDDTLAEYGKTNPKWYEAFKAADKKYGSLAKRESLEDKFASTIINPNTKEVSYTPLVKVLDDRKNRVFLKNNLGAANYKKLEDFVEVARAMDNVKRNVLNPSSTAIVNSVIGLFQMLVFGTNVAPAVAIGLGSAGATKLLTSKEFLNIAQQFAKKPTESLARRIDRIVKKHTGVGVQVLMKESAPAPAPAP